MVRIRCHQVITPAIEYMILRRVLDPRMMKESEDASRAALEHAQVRSRGFRQGGFAFRHHRRHFFYGASYYDYPYYYPYRRCHIVWTYYGPRRICHYRHWRHHYWRHHYRRHHYIY